MSWYLRFSRFRDVHAVYAQEAKNSCGIACVMMTVFKLKKLVPAGQPLHEEKEIYKVYGQASNTAYDGSAYTYANHLASTLNKLGVGSWQAENVGAGGVARAAQRSVGVVKPGLRIDYAAGKAPMIVLVGWDTNGAHFVVIDSIVGDGGNQFATVCDPWDGNVHVTPLDPGKLFDYTGAKVPWSWDLGGKKHEYKTPSTGSANGWVIRRI